MVQDFSTQFNPLYLLMKYLAIISRHPVYVNNYRRFDHKMLEIQLSTADYVVMKFYIWTTT